MPRNARLARIRPVQPLPLLTTVLLAGLQQCGGGVPVSLTGVKGQDFLWRWGCGEKVIELLDTTGDSTTAIPEFSILLPI